MTIKTLLPGATADVAKPANRTTTVRGGLTMISRRTEDWTSQSLGVGCNTPSGTETFGRGACAPTTSGRGALTLSGSGRGIMKFEDPGYIDVRRNELPTPERSGRSSRAQRSLST